MVSSRHSEDLASSNLSLVVHLHRPAFASIFTIHRLCQSLVHCVYRPEVNRNYTEVYKQAQTSIHAQKLRFLAKIASPYRVDLPYFGTQCMYYRPSKKTCKRWQDPLTELPTVPLFYALCPSKHLFMKIGRPACATNGHASPVEVWLATF